jgi:hypothetical protein
MVRSVQEKIQMDEKTRITRRSYSKLPKELTVPKDSDEISLLSHYSLGLDLMRKVIQTSDSKPVHILPSPSVRVNGTKHTRIVSISVLESHS